MIPEYLHNPWSDLIELRGKEHLIAALRVAGLPLSESCQDTEKTAGMLAGESVVCIADVRQRQIHGLVISSSGHVYSFEPDKLDVEFWAFAAEHYYIVTGNRADRQKIADLVDVDVKRIKGRTMRKRGKGLSHASIESMLEAFGYTDRQRSLF